MAHKTMISGTVREVSGGKTLVSGTVRDVQKGKTLVSGTVREIRFVVSVTITITGTGTGTGCGAYVTIDGTKYTAPATISVPSGTVARCSAYGKRSYIYLNDSTVASSSTNQSITYDYTISGSVTFTLSTGNSMGTVRITEA